ncbi:MAG: hypothetical protein GY696_31995, partial [Gammaproteobacteria bacterium]|nr:hypothetical protein [Gammaproteobacteria bacterium]
MMAFAGTFPLLANPSDTVEWDVWERSQILMMERKLDDIRMKLAFRNAPADEPAANRPTAETSWPRRARNREILAHLGTEGTRRYMSLPEADNVDIPVTDFLAQLKRLSVRDTNPHLARKILSKRRQRRNESASEFEAELRILAKDCAFVNTTAA